MKQDFWVDNTFFRIWNCCNSQLELAKEEAKAIVIDASKIKAPYDSKKTYIFRNVGELFDFRRGRYKDNLVENKVKNN